jgi:hypothetical protein
MIGSRDKRFRFSVRCRDGLQSDGHAQVGDGPAIGAMRCMRHYFLPFALFAR